MLVRSFLYLRRLKRNLQLPPSQLQALQLRKLKRMVQHAYANVPFYHRKFKAAQIYPASIRSVDDLSRLPMTTKQEIRACPLPEKIARSRRRCVKKTTSGATGVPLTLFVDSPTMDFEEALLARAYLENGLKYRDKMAVISDPRGFPPRPSILSRLGIVRRRYVSIFEAVETQLRMLEAYRPDVIKGYSSSVTMLADACQNTAHQLAPRLIFTSAEVLSDGSRRLLQKVFGSEVFDNYACYELGPLGWECQRHGGYHMNVDSVVMEFLKDGEPVAAGESGEIVCTGLSNRVMPLIRYKTGDLGIPVDEVCSCGVALPLMRMMEGRADDFLTTMDGRVVPPTVFFPYPFEEADFRGIAQFRIVQERRDKLVIHIAMREGFRHGDSVLQNAERRIQRLFGEAMRVEFRIVDELKRDPSGKLRKVISRIPINIG